MKYIVSILSILICQAVSGQGHSKRALFLGNSYTYVNNLPQMVADAASTAGDTLTFDSNTFGGYTLQQHSTDATSLNKIMAGNWDYVVLQEQSQLPSFPISQVETEVFPYAHKLDSIIRYYNPCGITVFYMTWGREYGDSSNCAVWPPVCTYSGMDSLLNLRYRMMADSNHALLSPVGEVRKYIRQNFPLIQLYQSDESHPTVAGTYAAACCFYTTFFRKDPAAIAFNSTLDSADAANIRTAAKMIVYDSLMVWHIGQYDPTANFTYVVSGTDQITFTNNSANSTIYLWNFGDGDTSAAGNPVHIFPALGSYTVTLIAGKCGKQDTAVQTVNVTPMGLQSQCDDNLFLNIYPNPVTAEINLDINFHGDWTYRIFDIFGSEIQRGNINDRQKQINVKPLSDGIYILRLFDGNIILGQQKFFKSSY